MAALAVAVVVASTIAGPVSAQVDDGVQPSIVVAPEDGLVHGVSLTVTGSGFGGRTNLYAMACSADGIDAQNDCDWRTEAWVPLGPDGTFTIESTASATLELGGRQVDCRPVGACDLVVFEWSDDRAVPVARTPLRFDPNGPLPPQPTIAVVPSDGLIDPGPVEVAGSGFTAGGPVSVAMCGDGGMSSRCEAETTVYASADDAGGFDVTLDASSTFGTGISTSFADCRREPCAVVASDNQTGRSARAPVTFGPLAPGRGRYLDPVFPETEVTEGIVYRRTTSHDGVPVELRMDLYQPAGDTAEKRPVVVWMPGGYFVFGDEKQLAGWAFDFARRGYVSASISYRLRPGMDTSDRAQQIEAGYDAYEDALAAVQWLRDHAEELRIDTDAIAAGGYSAGGALAFNFAYGPGQFGPDTPAVAAALAMAGGNIGVPEPGEPPVLVQHSPGDDILPIDNPREACEQARAVGNVCELIEFPGEPHVISKVRALTNNNAEFLAEHMLEPRGYTVGGQPGAGGAPEASAGPDVTVDEGGSVALDARGSSHPDGQPLSYRWEPADRLDDPTSATPTYTGVDDGTETLTLTVTDAGGRSATDDVTVTTRNVAPVIERVDTETEPGSPGLGLAIEVSDAGIPDTHVVEVDWGDGTIDTAAVDPEHAYGEPGRYDVAVTVTDDDGGTATWADRIVVGCTIVGTDGPDRLMGTKGGDVMCGLDGNDLMLGLSGDDVIHGGEGRDLAMGGRGFDRCDAEIRISCWGTKGAALTEPRDWAKARMPMGWLHGRGHAVGRRSGG